MANITRRAAKRLADHLLDGEEVEVAVLVEPKGTYGLGMVAMTLLPRTTDDALTGRADRRNAESGGLAARFPGESCAIAVTGTRILVAPTNGLRWRPPAMTLHRGQMFVDDSRGRGLGRRLGLVFHDGTGVQVDAQRGQPMNRFVEAVGRVPRTG